MPAGVFYPSEAPSTVTGNDDTSGYLMGTAILTLADVHAVGVAIYAPTDIVSTSGYVAYLFGGGDGGAQLARKAFGTLAPGWNLATFTSPVSVSSGTYLTAAVRVPPTGSQHSYAYTSGRFSAADVVVGSLDAVQNGADAHQSRPNGVFSPTSTDDWSGGQSAPTWANSGATWYAIDLLVGSSTTVPIGPAGEVETARPLHAVKRAALHVAAARETAQRLVAVKRRTLGVAHDVGTARPLAAAKHAQLGRALEVSAARHLTIGAASVPGELTTATGPVGALSAGTGPLAELGSSTGAAASLSTTTGV